MILKDIENKINEIENKPDLMDKILDFIFSLSPDQVSEDQAEVIAQLVDDLEKPEPIEEYVKKRVRRDLQAARERRREYRRHRAQRRLKARRYRRSAKGKQTLRKTKRWNKMGRTSKGNRQRKFVGPQLAKLKRT